MMVADTSALMAILLDEDEGPAFHAAMRRDGEVLVSAATAVELQIVSMGRSETIYEAALQLLGRPFIRIMPVDEQQLWVAAGAYRAYGRGRRSRAQLNFGDTFAYALASVRGLPLLYKGQDFVHTDILAVV